MEAYKFLNEELYLLVEREYGCDLSYIFDKAGFILMDKKYSKKQMKKYSMFMFKLFVQSM